MTQVVLPAVKALAEQPAMSTPLSLNATVPVGVPPPGAVASTVAVRVTDWEKVEGVGAATRPVVVLAAATTCEKEGVVPGL